MQQVRWGDVKPLLVCAAFPRLLSLQLARSLLALALMNHLPCKTQPQTHAL